MDDSTVPLINAGLNALITVLLLAGVFLIFSRMKRARRKSMLAGLVTSAAVGYLLIYTCFPPSAEVKEAPAVVSTDGRLSVVEARTESGDLVFTPAFQVYLAEAGQKRVEVHFTVQNDGVEPAKVERLDSGCECLLVEIDQDPVPPGASAIVTGVFDTEKLRGQSERKITIQFEGDRRPTFLTTRIETEPVYTIHEEMTTWEIGSEPETRVVEFRVVREEPVRVLSAESKRKEVTCELVTIEEGRAYDLLLTPDSTKESLLGIVRIETDCEIESYARPLAYFSVQ